MSYPNQPHQGQPHHQQQPYYQQPAQPAQPGYPGTYGAPQPQRRKGMPAWAIVLIVAGSVLGLCLVGGVVVALSSSEDQPGTGASNETPAANGGESPQPAGDEPSEEPAQVAGIGDPVRDGKFEFTVTDVETGVESVGDDFLGKDAQGQFVLVHVTVSNIGDEAQLFDSSSQYMIDAEGREHSADSEAAIYIENSDSFLNEINPGNSVDAVVVFDIPADASPTSLRLHDSPFSGGIEVQVG